MRVFAYHQLGEECRGSQFVNQTLLDRARKSVRIISLKVMDVVGVVPKLVDFVR
jgi:hypothetical protein